eukprot:4169605-Ditylum_brightwellii.AAC.1
MNLTICWSRLRLSDYWSPTAITPAARLSTLVQSTEDTTTSFPQKWKKSSVENKGIIKSRAVSYREVNNAQPSMQQAVMF